MSRPGGDRDEGEDVKNPRDDYLIQWRLSLWQSIRHKELLIWSFFGFYVAAVGLISVSAGAKISPLLRLVSLLALSALGAHVVLDAVSWAAKNVFTISRIEHYFVRGEVGVLIPEFYLKPGFRVSSINKVQYMIVGIVLLGSCAEYMLVFTPPDQTLSAGALLKLGAVAVALLWLFDWLRKSGDSYRRSYFRFREGFTNDPAGAVLSAPSTSDQSKAALEDPSWIVSAGGTSVVLVSLTSALFGVLIPAAWALLWVRYGLVVVVLGNVAYQLVSWLKEPKESQRRILRCSNLVLAVLAVTMLVAFLVSAYVTPVFS